MLSDVTPLLTKNDHERQPIHSFDQVLNFIGDFGAWQWLVIALLWLPAIGAGIIVLLWSFTGLEPYQFRCALPDCDSASSQFQDIGLDAYFKDPLYPNFCQRPILNHSLFVNGSRYWCENLPVVGYEKCGAQDQIIYGQFEYQSTLVTDLNLVCKDQFKVALVGTGYMIGLFIGSLLGSYPADIFGRKPLIFGFILLGGGANLVNGFLNEFWSYFVVRMICGVGEMGMVMVAFTLSVELVGAKHQAFVGNMNQLMFAVGECISGLLAYFIRDWRTLHYAASALVLPQLLLWWVIPESPRWLMTKKKWARASKVIRTAQKLNKKTIPDDFTLTEAKSNYVQDDEEKKEMSVWILLSNKILRKRFVIMALNWTLVAMVYYGIGMSMTVLGGDIFINFTGAALVEIVGYIIAILTSDHWGRKPVMVFSFLVSGVACLISGFVPDTNVWKIILVLVGKMGSSSAFSTAYVFTAELFPTPIRGTAVGMCSMVGRIGSLAAPQLALFLPSLTFDALPLIVFGVAGIVAGIVSLMLPETLGFPLPDTLFEAAQCSIKGKSKSMFSCWSRKKLDEEVSKQRKLNEELAQDFF